VYGGRAGRPREREGSGFPEGPGRRQGTVRDMRQHRVQAGNGRRPGTAWVLSPIHLRSPVRRRIFPAPASVSCDHGLNPSS
jgi:hypothetical protein